MNFKSCFTKNFPGPFPGGYRVAANAGSVPEAAGFSLGVPEGAASGTSSLA